MRGIFAIVRLSYLNISLHAGADHDLQSPCNRIIISLIPGPEYLCRNPAPDSPPGRWSWMRNQSISLRLSHGGLSGQSQVRAICLRNLHLTEYLLSDQCAPEPDVFTTLDPAK